MTFILSYLTLFDIQNDSQITKVWTEEIEPYFIRLQGGLLITKSYILKFASSYYPNYLLREEILKNKKFLRVSRGSYFQDDYYDYGPSKDQLEFHNVVKVHNSGIIGWNVPLAIFDTGFDSTNTSISHLWRQNRIIASWDFNSGDSLFIFNIKNKSFLKVPIPSGQTIYISDYDFLDSIFVISLAFESDLTSNPYWRIYISDIKNNSFNEIVYQNSKFLLEPKIKRKSDSILVFFKSWIGSKNYSLNVLNLKSNQLSQILVDNIVQYDVFVSDSIYYAYGTENKLKIYDNSEFFGRFGGLHYFNKDSLLVSLNDSIFLIYKFSGSWNKEFKFKGKYPVYCDGKIAYVRNDSVFLQDNFLVYELFSDRPDCKNFKVLSEIVDGFYYDGQVYNVEFSRILKIYNDSLIVLVRRGDNDVYPEYPNSGAQYHGIVILSVIAGLLDGSLIGVSPGVKLILAKTEKTIFKDNPGSGVSFENVIEEDFWVNALEWAIRKGARIISSSLGYINWYNKSDLDGKTAISSRVASKAINYNVLVVTAMGNVNRNSLINNPDTSLFAPADADSIIAVGGIDYDLKPSKNSSFGPSADGRIKPDVVALFGPYRVYGYDGIYYTYGTSLSTAIVAGICALALQAHPSWSAKKLREVILNTAKEIPNYPKPNNFTGYGLIDAYSVVFYEPIENQLDLSNFLLYPYPNPAKDYVKIKIRNYENISATLKILSLSGKVMYERNLSQIPIGETEIKIDIKSWDKGIYIISVYSNKFIYTQKFVKI
ncbi:MAG: S8/S53 family peptidase [candidate division WOR-3 bacterium]